MSDKPRAVSSHDITLDKEYAQWIHDIKQRFRNAQIKASVPGRPGRLICYSTISTCDAMLCWS